MSQLGVNNSQRSQCLESNWLYGEFVQYIVGTVFHPFFRSRLLFTLQYFIYWSIRNTKMASKFIILLFRYTVFCVLCASALVIYMMICQTLYRIAQKCSACTVFSMYFLVICLLVTLIVFPVVFIKQEIQTYKETFGHSEWNFSWSYGVCWGAWLFLLGAAVLLLIDRTQNDEVRKKKGFYDTHLWVQKGRRVHVTLFNVDCRRQNRTKLHNVLRFAYLAKGFR